MDARMAQVVGSGEFPYRTVHDLVRDSVVHRLHELGVMVKSQALVEYTELQLAIASMEFASRRQAAAILIMETFQTMTTNAASDRD